MSAKLAKEQFVSSLSGTSLGEIYLLTATLIAGYLLRCVLVVCNPQKSPLIAFLTEYATVILPGVLAFTVLADYSHYVLALLILASAVVAISQLLVNGSSSVRGYRGLSQLPYPTRLPCVTLTRTFITLITAIAILAVDFRIFPRRLAKAETYGTGLMDVGVGAFIMSHALTSPEAREKGGGVKLMATLRGISPLVVLGVLRVLAVKSTDYQEHVTEYGVHWNFFFTIAAVRMLATLLHPLLNSGRGLYGIASLLTALSYQLALSCLGLSNYIQHGPHGDGSRPTLLSANREGVWSCVGYLAIYLGHIEVGRWLFRPRESVQKYVWVLGKLFSFSCLSYCVTVLCAAYVEPTSRRIVNLAYIAWIFSYGGFTVGLFLLTDLITYTLTLTSYTPHTSLHTPHTPHKLSDSVCIVSAVDHNQLAFFLLSNLFTGLVNFTMDTLAATTTTSLAILTVYMCALVCVFLVLFRMNIKLKL